MPHPAQLIRLALASAALLIATGCAIQTNRNGQVEYQFDDAELLGKVVQTVRMPDGSQAKLRQLGDQLSVKLQKRLTVIPIQKATQADIVSVHQVGSRAVMRIGKSSPGCTYDTQLLALQGREVLSWDFGDCERTPKATVYADGITYDFTQGDGSIVRFTYHQEGRLTRTVIPSAQAGAYAEPVKPIAGDAPRYVPGLPDKPTSGDRPAATATNRAAAPAPEPQPQPRPAARTNQNTARSGSGSGSASGTNRIVDFPSQEQKPVRIVLDK